jgi:hypothetical protein
MAPRRCIYLELLWPTASRRIWLWFWIMKRGCRLGEVLEKDDMDLRTREHRLKQTLVVCERLFAAWIWRCIRWMWTCNPWIDDWFLSINRRCLQLKRLSRCLCEIVELEHTLYPSNHPSIHPSIYPSIHPSMCLPARLPARPPACQEFSTPVL